MCGLDGQPNLMKFSRHDPWVSTIVYIYIYIYIYIYHTWWGKEDLKISIKIGLKNCGSMCRGSTLNMAKPGPEHLLVNCKHI